MLQPAVLEHTDLIADGKGFFLVMGDQDGADATGFEDVPHLMAEAPAQVDVEVGEWLVEQQQFRLRRQRARQRDTLLLPARKFVGVAFAQMRQVHQRQHLVNDALGLGMLANAEGNVIRHRQVREQGVVLKHHADAPFLGRQGEPGAGQHGIAQLNLAFVDWLEAGYGPQRGGLAAAGRTEQATDVATVQMQVQVLHDALLAIAAGEVA